MKTTVIICEYNPMTNGHVLHIEKAKQETQCDTLICVMSGSFTQRGDAAITDKYIRAFAAIKVGADMVVELPTIYAISPCDNFAYGAIKSVSALPNVEYLSFGSECGDADLLQKLARLLINEPEEVKKNLQQWISEGMPFPKARAKAIDLYADLHEEYRDIKGLLDCPNNVLGVAYIMQIIKAGLDIKIHTIKRVGSDFNDETFSGKYSSASAIRKALQNGDVADIKNAVPLETLVYLYGIKKSTTSLNDMMLYKLKTMSGFDLDNYYDVSGGIHNKLKLAAAQTNTFEDMLEKAKTKNYTMARLKRICLYALLDITKEMYQAATACPAYVQILALRKIRKDDILSALSISCKNVLTRYSDVSRVDKSLRFLIKLDFSTQGMLDIINHSDYYNKKMLLY